MTSLLFHDLPPGPVPLYVGEAGEGVEEFGTLLLDHVGREVRFVKADPFEAFKLPDHSLDRYSQWNVDAMMPRWQLRELYGEVRPLLERIHMGTTMTRLPTHWVRARTPEALATVELVEEMALRPAEAAIEWVPTPRTLRPETALERAIRLHEGRPLRVDGWEAGPMRTVGEVAFLMQMAEKELFDQPISADERRMRNMLAHPIRDQKPIVSLETGSGKTKGTFVLATKALKEICSGSETDLEISTLKGDSRVQLQAKGKPGVSLFTSRMEAQLRILREQERKLAGQAQWRRLFEQTDTRRMAG